MHSLTLTVPLRDGSSYLDTLSPFTDQTPLSALIPHLERMTQKSLFPTYGTATILFRTPLFPDNRVALASLSFGLSDEETLCFYLLTISAFPTPTQAMIALRAAPENPLSFWLQVRQPYLFRELSECPLLRLPMRLKPAPFPNAFAKPAQTAGSLAIPSPV